MAKQNVFLPSVNAGEFSPKLESRIDFNKYPNGAKRLKNALLLPQGGWYRRPGTRYTANTKSDGEASLIPFVFNEEDAFVVEAGNQYFRFIRRQSQLTVADTDASVTNGDFTSNITDWDDRSDGSAAIAHDAANGRLQLTGSAGDTAWAEQDITTTNTGTAHTIRFRVQGTLGLSCLFQVGTTSTGSELSFENGSTQLELGIGWHTITFTPDASPFYVQFGNDNTLTDSSENIFIDDVSLLDNAPLELTHPYSASEAHDLVYEQAGDILYLLHEDYWTYKLERRGTNTWSMVEVFWEDGPWNEINENSDLTKTQLVTNPQFFTGIMDWVTTCEAGTNARIDYDGEQQFVSLITPASGQTASIQYQVATGFRSSTSTWYTAHFLIVGSSSIFEQGTTVNIGTTAGAAIHFGGTEISGAEYHPGWHTVDFQATAATLYFTFSYDRVQSAAGNGGVAALFVYPQDARLLDVSGQTGSITVTARGFSPFASTDVGRYIRFEYPGREAGWGVITAFTNSTTVTLQVRRRIPIEAHTESWRLGAWSDTTGFAKSLTFFEGRSIFDRNDSARRTLQFSQSLRLEDHRPDSFVEGGNTVEDDDALTFTLSSPQPDKIQWLTSLQRLIVGTLGGPWIATSTGPVITPTDRSFLAQTSIKTTDVRPLLVGNAVLFLDLAKEKLLELVFQFENDQFVATDLTKLADHVSDVQLVHKAYQQDPDPVIWVSRDTHDVVDGQLYPLTYSRGEDIVGWTRMELGGSYTSGRLSLPAVESVITIPGFNDSNQTFNSGDRDEVWVVTVRTVNSSTIRTIEMFEKQYNGPKREEYSTEAAWVTAIQSDQTNAFYVDSGITVVNGSPSTAVSGLDHLEGESVTVLADGKIQGPFTVSSGAITLDTAATTVHVGLAYTTEFESLKMPYGAQQGTGMVKAKSVTSIPISFLDTAGMSVGLVSYDKTSGRTAHATETITRTKSSIKTLDTFEFRIAPQRTVAPDVRVFMSTSEPLPATVLGYGADADTSDTTITT